MAVNYSGEAYKDLLARYDAAVAASVPDYSGAEKYLKQQAAEQQNALKSQYEAGARNAYINYQQAKRDIPQQMGSVGLSGTGMAETSLVGLNSNYGNQLASLRENMASGVRAINADIASKMYANMISRAEASAKAQGSAADYYQQLLAASVKSATKAGNGTASNNSTGGYGGKLIDPTAPVVNPLKSVASGGAGIPQSDLINLKNGTWNGMQTPMSANNTGGNTASKSATISDNQIKEAYLRGGAPAQMTTDKALREAAKASPSAVDQLNYVRQLANHGRITETQLTKISNAIVSPK